MYDLMLDLETLSTTHNAAIIQIAACYFNRETGVIEKTFFRNVDPLEKYYNFEVSTETVFWWMQQQKNIIDDLYVNICPINEVLQDFNNFILKDTIIWSHATFDFVILMNAFNKTNIKPKLHYRNSRDLRTLVDLAKMSFNKNEERISAHNALNDCLYQVEYAVKCFSKFSKKI